MLLIENDSKYADTIERILYNNGLSSFSLDGKSFFYVNPLAIRTHLLERNTSQENTHENLTITQRKEVFDCSCCPPNITRFIASVADFLYTYSDDTVYVHQYMNSETVTDSFSISQKTEYPNNGRIEIKTENIRKLAVRIPGWCDKYELTVDGNNVDAKVVNGYAMISNLSENSVIVLDFEITPFVVYPHQKSRIIFHVLQCREGLLFTVQKVRIMISP